MHMLIALSHQVYQNILKTDNETTHRLRIEKQYKRR